MVKKIKKKELIPFGKNLKYLRRERGLTLREVAKLVGIGKSTLSEYENALTDPTLTAVQKLADFYDEDINWLAGETNARRLKKKLSEKIAERWGVTLEEAIK